MTPHHAAAVTRWFTSRWHFGPPVKIAPTARDLPFPAPDDVRGAHWRGEVHLVAQQPADSLVQTIAHEAVGHHGLRVLFGKDWPHFMRHVTNGVQAGDPGLKKIQSHIRETYVDELGEYTLTSRQEADEIAAYVAEDLVCFRTGAIKPDRPWPQALEAAKGWMLREGLCMDGRVSRSELEGALFLATKKMEGWPWQRAGMQIGRAWRACCTIAEMSKFDPYKPPMSLAESERLLRAEADHRKAKDEWAMVGNFLLGILSLILFFGGIALTLHSFFG